MVYNNRETLTKEEGIENECEVEVKFSVVNVWLLITCYFIPGVFLLESTQILLEGGKTLVDARESLIE